MTKHTPDTLADSAFPVQTLHSETVFTGAIWDVTSERFTYPTAEGRSALRREYIHHPGAVAIIAMNEHNQVLLLQQYRHPVKQKLWEVPAGLLDHEGESMLQAAQRELAEEADLRARCLGALGGLLHHSGQLLRGYPDLPSYRVISCG